MRPCSELEDVCRPISMPTAPPALRIEACAQPSIAPFSASDPAVRRARRARRYLWAKATLTRRAGRAIVNISMDLHVRFHYTAQQ
jgi:hypothetical protein